MKIKHYLIATLPTIKKFAPTVGKAIEVSDDIRAKYLVLTMFDKFGLPPFNPFNLDILIDSVIYSPYSKYYLQSIEKDNKALAIEILKSKNLTSNRGIFDMKINDFFKKALPIIEKVAPTIGSAIAGPEGMAVGYLIPILADQFGTHPSNVKELVDNIINDPNSPIKLKAVEDEHGKFVLELMGNDDLPDE